MTIILLRPELTAYFQDASVGTLVAGCLLMAFLVLALGFGVFQMRGMKKKMNMLDEESRARRAQQLALEEEFANIGCSPKRPAQQMKDPWQS